MGEKAYKSMKAAGAWNIVFGAVAIATGIAIGIGCILTSIRLLKDKSNITF